LKLGHYPDLFFYTALASADQRQAGMQAGRQAGCLYWLVRLVHLVCTVLGMTKRKIPQHRTFGHHSFWDTHCQSYPVFRRHGAVPDPVRLSSDSAIGVTDSVVANTVLDNPYRRIRPESIPAQRRAGDGSYDSCTSREHRREPSQNTGRECASLEGLVITDRKERSDQYTAKCGKQRHRNESAFPRHCLPVGAIITNAECTSPFRPF
jgi:hypothetical protein